MSHGGLAEMLLLRRGPNVGQGWPLRGRYVSGLARHPKDPDAWCMSKNEADEKAKRQGKLVLES